MKKVILFSVVVLLLASCAFWEKKDVAYACPATGIMTEANQFAVFSSSAATPKPENVTLTATVAGFHGDCDFGKSGQVRVSLSVLFKGKKNKLGLGAGRQDIPYFVALLSPDEEIMSRQAYTTSLDFTVDGKAVVETAKTEEVKLVLPISKPEDAGKYKLAIGFSLTPEQLAYNRRKP